MGDNGAGNGISRRKFLKGFGTGMVGSTVILNSLGAATKEEKEQMREYLQNAEPLTLTVNGKKHRLMVEARTTLAEVLRNHLQLTGTKIVCNQGECGGCTVLLDGMAIYSCHLLALDAAGKSVTTIEGLLTGEELHPLQEAFVEKDGLQCGFCTPGQIMAAKELLAKNPKPTRKEIQHGMAGNICRCAAYPKIIESVEYAAGVSNSK
ncbi:MAG: (2Fe-2S)-binding protein [Candidatus Marinimicrobia bacterium]|nr:(2Fe-2S)-binding protein [Candidatus Neomarinimicrobiota bacterium]MCF7829540.1 (2Fe-2S)-binding protein [Candidatus Neomarinimicrobiota bacterium]MCF7880062.1 (2Fe-2S)-binding protein [Candidatus Neomarinimicrobiota bacterium]